MNRINDTMAENPTSPLFDMEQGYLPLLSEESTTPVHDTVLDTDQVRNLPISQVSPAPENDMMYRPVDPTDPEIIALAESILTHGIKEPLVLTLDYVLLSGHRRYAAAKLAGLLEVPVRFDHIHSKSPNFMQLLPEYNRQRKKTLLEVSREEVVTANPNATYRMMKEHRKKEGLMEVQSIQIEAAKQSPALSEAKIPLLNASIDVMNNLRNFWPLSLRQIHYQLLNNPPLIHANKPNSFYHNDQNCYKALSELLKKARLEGYVPMEVMSDNTRPVTLSTGHDTTAPFISQALRGFMQGYYRNLQQSQPNHIEIVGEKNTVQSVLKPIAEEYCIPLTIGRGYCSVPPRQAMAERFAKSGKENLILLGLTDFDPDGEEIFQNFARSMRDEFNVPNIRPIKVGLTYDQVRQMNLPPGSDAKTTSSNYAKFVEKYGTNVYELEAVAPTMLQDMLRKTIDSVMDLDAYNREIDKEKEDAVALMGMRKRLIDLLKYDIFFEDDDEDAFEGPEAESDTEI